MCLAVRVEHFSIDLEINNIHERIYTSSLVIWNFTFYSCFIISGYGCICVSIWLWVYVFRLWVYMCLLSHVAANNDSLLHGGFKPKAIKMQADMTTAQG